MAKQVISMNIIKQVLIRLSQKESIRSIASALYISKNTVNRYKLVAEADIMSVRELLALEDTTLKHRVNGGYLAYCDVVDVALMEHHDLLPIFHKTLRILAHTVNKHLIVEAIFSRSSDFINWPYIG